MTEDAINDLGRIERYPRAPLKRAAYSDRTAWLMAVLSELAYTPFDQDDDSAILALARELAELTNRDQIAERLKGLAALLGSARPGVAAAEDNTPLREALAAGGFALKGVLFHAGTDTQGYVATKRPGDGPGMAVLAFRGTQQVKDWLTNLDAVTTPISSSDGETLGNVHRGFNQAFLSVRARIDELLDGDEDLPLYITGHSLGGALATLATWYLKGDSLAACYTFGAPRVGDTGLMDRFRTPIYRIVNGVDPVPFVPPSGRTVSFMKHSLRLVGTVIGPVERLADRLVRYQGYRHYGFQRYLNICDAGPDGNFPRLRLEFAVSPLVRIGRMLGKTLRGEFTRGPRVDKYHNMDLYRAKLRAFAKKRQQRLTSSGDEAIGAQPAEERRSNTAR